MKPTLSVIVIARDAEAKLERCLESAAFADEIVVLDSGSTDSTPEIATRYASKFHVDPDWQGFGIQKNRALDLAGGDWVLSLDADEWVTPELRKEICRALSAPAADVYAMPRRSSFCGREMRHSGWWPDHVIRLFRRGTARFSEDLVHERLVFAGRAVRLARPLLHESVRSLEEALDKLNRYSTASAEQRAAAGASAGVFRAIGHGFWAFTRTYLLRAGFLDGREGFLMAVATAEGTYYRYLKLMYLAGSRRKASRKPSDILDR